MTTALRPAHETHVAADARGLAMLVTPAGPGRWRAELWWPDHTRGRAGGRVWAVGEGETHMAAVEALYAQVLLVQRADAVGVRG